MPTTQTVTRQLTPATFESVWALTQENAKAIDRLVAANAKARKAADRQMKENAEAREETDRLTKENVEGMKEHDRRMKEIREQSKKHDRILTRIEKNLGGLGQSLGMLIETLIAAKLWEKFDRLHYDFVGAYQRVPIYDRRRHAVAEIDILLTDDNYVMAVEVKTQFDKKDDVDHHLQRMERILKWPPAACKGKVLLGAIAGGTVSPEVRDYAHAAGVFVLELTGDAVTLARRPAGFKAREW
jgi:small-conductance mechanosensitive channel